MAVTPREALVGRLLSPVDDALALEEARIDGMLRARYTGGITWVPLPSDGTLRGRIERRYRAAGWRVVYVGNWQGAPAWGFSAEDPGALEGV